MWARPAPTVVTLAFALGLAACSSDGGGTVGSSSMEACPVEKVPIVVSVDQWGDIVGQLAGPCGDVTTIISGSSVDPHDYEPTPADSATFTGAELVVVNGLGYDAWADKAVAASGRHPVVVDAGDVVGLEDGANPHLWYSPDYVTAVAEAVTSALKEERPDAAGDFDRWHADFVTSLQPYTTAVADVRALAGGATYGATESVFDDMAAAVGLRDLTPPGYRAAAANESEPAPADLHAFEETLQTGTMSVLIYNTQTEGAIPAQLRQTAVKAGVPVVEVTETVAAGATSFVDWQVGQLRRLAARAPRRLMTAAVALDDVSAARGGRTIWSEGTFSIPTGAIVGVIGPNGSGKTTLLHMLLGLLPPATGTIEVMGRAPHRGDPRIGYVPQGYTAEIGDAIRVRDLVTLGAVGTRWGIGPLRADERARVAGALEAVGAAGFARRRMSEISGGQQQRVAVAQALVGRPELLLLDEPLANLDVRNQHEVVTLLEQIRTAEGVTILIVAHDLNPLLSILTGAIYLVDGHAHYGAIGEVVDDELLTHLYGTVMRVVKTPQGELFTRSL